MNRVARDPRDERVSVEQSVLFGRKREERRTTHYSCTLFSRASALGVINVGENAVPSTYFGRVLACVFEQDLDPTRMRRRKLVNAAPVSRRTL